MTVCFVAFAGCFLKTTLARVLGVFAVLLCCAASLPAQAEDDWDRSIKGNPDFADVRSQLQMLVNIKGFHAVNQFCVVATSDLSEAEVYWLTEGKLILWEPMDIPFALLWSRDYVDLQHDVVRSAKDITLQYMVLPWTRPQVNQVISNCEKYGSKFIIHKSESGWVPISTFPRFSSIKIQLQTLVNAQGHSKSNEFCVIGQQDGSYLAAYVYWVTENKLIMWNPDPHDFSEPHGLVNSFSTIDLKTGAVDQEFYSRTTAEMPRPYANEILRACQASGEKFTVIKSD